MTAPDRAKETRSTEKKEEEKSRRMRTENVSICQPVEPIELRRLEKNDTKKSKTKRKEKGTTVGKTTGIKRKKRWTRPRKNEEGERAKPRKKNHKGVTNHVDRAAPLSSPDGIQSVAGPQTLFSARTRWLEKCRVALHEEAAQAERGGSGPSLTYKEKSNGSRQQQPIMEPGVFMANCRVWLPLLL